MHTCSSLCLSQRALLIYIIGCFVLFLFCFCFFVVLFLFLRGGKGRERGKYILYTCI